MALKKEETIVVSSFQQVLRSHLTATLPTQCLQLGRSLQSSCLPQPQIQSVLVVKVRAQNKVIWALEPNRHGLGSHLGYVTFGKFLICFLICKMVIVPSSKVCCNVSTVLSTQYSRKSSCCYDYCYYGRKEASKQATTQEVSRKLQKGLGKSSKQRELYLFQNSGFQTVVSLENLLEM